MEAPAYPLGRRVLLAGARLCTAREGQRHNGAGRILSGSAMMRPTVEAAKRADGRRLDARDVHLDRRVIGVFFESLAPAVQGTRTDLEGIAGSGAAVALPKTQDGDSIGGLWVHVAIIPDAGNTIKPLDGVAYVLIGKAAPLLRRCTYVSELIHIQPLHHP